MASVVDNDEPNAAGDERFFLKSAIVIAVVIVAAFSIQIMMGRSSFASPMRVHVHAVLFMGWVAIYTTQNVFITAGSIDLHRRLGWLAIGWVPAMIVSAYVVVIAIVRNGTVPFFIQPVHFLIFDFVGLFTFGGLTAMAILLRRKTEWHRRLHFCGMTMLTQPALGRLLPMPYLQPWALEVSFLASLLFPLSGMFSDFRRGGQVHVAWAWGTGAILFSFVLIQAMTYSALGTLIYEVVTVGSRGSAVPPLEFQRAPEGSQLTGRP